MVSRERVWEVESLLARTQTWADRRPDVVAVGMFGSWARGEALAREDSDVDLAILSREPRRYVEDGAWVRALGGLRIARTRSWGPMTERRFILPSGLEVEAGIASPSWASTDPVDPELRPIVRAGARIIYDPEGLLARLVEACR